MGPKINGIILLLVALGSVLGSPIEYEDTTEPGSATANMLEDITESSTPSRFSNLLDYISNQNSIHSEEFSSIIPYQVIDKTSLFLVKNGYDPYSLSDLLIPGPSVSLFRKAQCSQVLLQDGKLYGMSDFHSVDDFKADQSQLWLMWKHLRVTFRVTVDIEGLLDSGDLDVEVGRLLMHVQAASTISTGLKIETSRIKTFKSKLTGLEITSEDVKSAICLEAESRLKNVLNGKVRYLLHNHVRRTIQEDSSDNDLVPLQISQRFYEVHFG